MARDSFTDQQWQQLVEAGPSIARAVSAVSGSTAQTETELEAFLRLLERTRNETGSGNLLGQLVSDVHARLSAGAIGLAVDDVVADGVHAARQAGAVLGLEPDEQEARAVRHWLFEVARTVAGASREGGILGLGGQDVSQPERDTIAAIADGLGMAPEQDIRGREQGKEGSDQGGAETSDRETDEPAGGGQPRLEETPSAEAEIGPDGQPVGPDNIRDGTVRGVMGGPHQQGGEGQG